MIEVTDKIKKEDWDKLLSNSKFSSPFQTLEFYEFLRDLTFLDAFVFGVLQNNELVALASGYIVKEGSGVKGYFSRRAIIHGGILIGDNCQDKTLESLLIYLGQNLKKRVIYTEIRNYFDYSKYKNTFEKTGFNYEQHLNFHVKTKDVDSAFSQLSTSKRRQIRNTIKKGVNLLDNPNLNDIKGFYQLLNDLYKNKVKLPLFPFEFFEKLKELPSAKLFILKYEQQIVGGSVCLELEGNSLYELYVCGLDREFKNVYASVLATWSAIEYGGKTNIEYFDMMGAGKPNDGYGVREFKSKFGGELVEFGRFKFISNPVLFNIGKVGLSLLQKL